MTEHISIKDLSYTYPDGKSALSDINLSISKGERVALIGPNGAGKSTLLLQLNGILRGDGSIAVDGLALADDNLREIRRKVGMIFQDPNDQLFCPTVKDDVSYGPLHFDIPKDRIDDIVRDSLKRVGMEHAMGRPAHHLSLGERRRVTLAAVFACKPSILALDEPAAMLDPKRRRWLIDFLNADSRTVILATHDLGFARETCQRSILMKDGRIIADGRINDMLSDFSLLENNDLESPKD